MDMNKEVVVVEVPHRLPPKVYMTTPEKIIEWAHSSGNYLYLSLETEEAVREYFDFYFEDFVEDEVFEKYQIASELVRKEGKAVIVDSDTPESKEHAGSEYDWAIRVLFHDLNHGGIYDSLGEAFEDYRTSARHQKASVMAKLESMLEKEE